MWKESSGQYQSVFSQSLCLYRGMLGDKSSPKEVWNQRKIRCWSSACLVRKLRNISSLCSLVAFQVWRLSIRCHHSCQEMSGCLLRHAFRLFTAQTPACRGDSWRDWCLNSRLSRRHGSARLQHKNPVFLSKSARCDEHSRCLIETLRFIEKRNGPGGHL